MSTNRLRVVLEGGAGYDIRVGTRLLANFGRHLVEALEPAGLKQPGQAVIISDSNVGPLYLASVRASLERAGFSPADMTIPAGEASKSVEVAAELWDALALLGTGRDSLIVALGGGVVGDLVGFVAATYMRGVACAQVPTSLLAMVDSSVGGKTAVNIQGGKNLVGSFSQPIYVAADLETLTTLPAAEWDNGFAEIAKSALIDGGDFHNWLGKEAANLAAHDADAVQQAIVRSLSFKARVVARDERESGLRECLNYGHTFAHALEAATDYSISHGQAVAEGIRFAAHLATEAIGAPEQLASDQEALLDALGLAPISQQISADELFTRMLADKKVRNGQLRFVLLKAPGDWETVTVDPDLVKIYLILWEQARM
jgi:3-dehydroquinate synthase